MFLPLFGNPAQEKFSQPGDVFPAVAQRGEQDGKDVQAVEEVFAESPLATSSMRSRLVAAMMRTSTFMVRLPPTRSNSPSWIIRSSLTWRGGANSPISSRKRVPPSASSKRPNLRVWRR